MNTSDESVFPKNGEEGVRRVKAGGYAYLAESTSVEYVVERNCDLEQIGGLLDSKGYGIATPEGMVDVLLRVLIILWEEIDLST